MFQIYDKVHDEIVDPETHPYFKDYEVAVTLDGKILLLQYGSVISCAHDNYQVRAA